MTGVSEWIKVDHDEFRYGGAKAERNQDPDVFVVLDFGPARVIDEAHKCLAAATQYGQLAILDQIPPN